MKVDVQERVNRAMGLFREGYNCTQSVVLAYTDLFGVDKDMAATFSGAFGGGMGRLREVCGTVSGMAVLAGFLSPYTDPKDNAAKKKTYTLIQNFAESFRAENRYIVCRDLLGLGVKKEDPTPSERTAEYYKKRPCVELVGCAARIVGEYINSADEENGKA